MKIESENLESGIVHIEIGARKLDIPARYMYSEAIDKRKHWPKAKGERVKVGAISFSTLLPDLRPYKSEDDARWKALGHGDRVEATLSVREGWTPAWIIELYDRTQGEIKEGRTLRQPDVHGLEHYITPAKANTYFPATIDERFLIIDCDRLDKGLFSPGCHVRSVVRPGLELSYDFGFHHLSEWRRIDAELKEILVNFIVVGKAKQKPRANITQPRSMRTASQSI